LLKKELPRYIATSLLAVTADFNFYSLLQDQLDYDRAKGTSFIAGSTAAFTLHRSWIF